MKLKGVVFDLDGTLVDSMWYWDKLGEEYLAAHGKKPLPDFREKYYVYSTDETAKMIVGDYGLDETPEDVIAGMIGMASQFYRERAELKPHAKELLDRLQSAGVRMALATATERRLVDIAVERCGIGKYLDAIVTCTDVAASKTQPDVYLKAMGYLGTEVSETAVFEDAVIAAGTAHKAGFYTVGVYDGTAREHESRMRAFCDEYIYDYSELSKLFG